MPYKLLYYLLLLQICFVLYFRNARQIFPLIPHKFIVLLQFSLSQLAGDGFLHKGFLCVESWKKWSRKFSTVRSTMAKGKTPSTSSTSAQRPTTGQKAPKRRAPSPIRTVIRRKIACQKQDSKSKVHKPETPAV